MRKLSYLLIASPFIYFIASLVGGLSNDGYNHIVDTVSDLLVDGMGNLEVVKLIMVLSNLAVLFGGIALSSSHKSRFTKGLYIGFILLALTGLSNIFSAVVFPLDHTTEASFSSTMHVVFVAVSALLSIVAMILIAFNYNKVYSFKRFKLYTFVSLFVLAGGALLTPIVIETEVDILGLVERISILGLYQWQIVTTLHILRGNHND